jgi:hypothetical protein
MTEPSSQVHSNQKECGDAIIRAFMEDGKYHVLLLAQMQMGKSGTYWYVILSILFKGLRGIDNIVLMSGNRESELHEQVLSDKKAYIAWFLDNQDIAVSSKKALAIKLDKSIQIAWGGQLWKKNSASFSVRDNTLIVWDEAHYAQSDNNAPGKFFRANNLDTLLNGTVSTKEISARNISLLTGSATPFSELAVSCDPKVPKGDPKVPKGDPKVPKGDPKVPKGDPLSTSLHKVVRLEPGQNYYGMEHYMKKDLIRSSFVVNEDNRCLLKEVLLKHQSDEKYMIVRVTYNREKQKLIREVCKDLGFAYKYYNSRRKDIRLSDLATKPIVPTVVIISGMLRMGKVIPKEHLSMVFEASTQNGKRKVDTGLQGLLGRVCGYCNKTDPNVPNGDQKVPNDDPKVPKGDGFHIAVYVEESIVDDIQQYLADYDTETGPICTNAMNICPSRPVSKTLQKYNVFEIPVCNGFLTNKLNICKQPVVKWLKENYKSLNMNDSVLNLFEGLMIDMKCITKNLNTKFNRGLSKLVTGQNKTSNVGSLSKSTYYLMNNETKMWLVFWDHESEDALESEDEHDDIATDDLFVLNRCVFKSVK